VTDTTTTATGLRPMMRGGRRLRDGHILYWWFEVLAILAFYLVYSAIRNANGVHPSHAFRHAKEIISLEHHLGIFHEATIQKWALHWKPLIITANYLYGSLHFVVTIGVGIWLFRKQSNDYPRFRNTLAVTTGLALIGFSLYPLMPPRLLHLEHLNIGFVDTLQKYPTIWSFDSGPAARVSNQYAAMPSVHIAWATWCALAMVPRLKSTGAKILAACYPFVTLIVIVITANHYVLDAVGGLVILAIGWVVANKFTRAGRGRPIPELATEQ
jgi:PAP2 superfamily protein